MAHNPEQNMFQPRLGLNQATGGLMPIASALDPDMLLRCAKNIEEEFPLWAAELREKAELERAALRGEIAA